MFSINMETRSLTYFPCSVWHFASSMEARPQGSWSSPITSATQVPRLGQVGSGAECESCWFCLVVGHVGDDLESLQKRPNRWYCICIRFRLANSLSYHLQEAHVIRNKLDAAKQRKLMLAAEVWYAIFALLWRFPYPNNLCGKCSWTRSAGINWTHLVICRFLRRRYKWLLKTKSLNSSQEQQIEQPLNLGNQTKNEELFFSRMGTTVRKLPSIPDTKSNGKLSIGKQSSRHSASLFNNLKREQVLHGGKEASHPISTLVSDKNNRGGIKCGKETLMQCAIPSFDLNQKERIYRANYVGLRNSTVAFDLNQDSDLSRKEACMPSRTPFFDLNEISVCN